MLLLLPSVPKIATDPNFASVSLLLHFDGANNGTVFTDNSSGTLTATRVGSATTSTANKQFGTAALYLSAAGDGLTFPYNTASLNVGTGKFTIEFWIKSPSYADDSYGNIIATGASSGNMIISTGVTGIGGTRGKLNYWASDLSGVTIISSTTTITDNALHFVAITRDESNLIRIYVDGNRENTGTDNTNHSVNSSYNFAIGSGYHNAIAGTYIDDLRVTKGVTRYVDATLTVPAAPFPNS